jgi:ribosomal protein L11 methyltransferase
MENYIQVNFQQLKDAEKEILIARLADIGYEGFEDGDEYLKAYIQESGFDKKLLGDVVSQERYPYTIDVIQEKNWNEEWEKSFQPVVIGNFCAIRAAFHMPVENIQHEVIITPKMSFGTGHHATTYMVVELMKEIDFKEKKVLDFGTGTGVLAILAEKLEAERILAIDNDDWSIDNAKENIHRNKCKNITLQKAEGIIGSQLFDIILANINKNVILPSLPIIAKHLTALGVLIVSGLLNTDYEDLVEHALQENLELQNQIEKSGWIAACFKVKTY